MSTNPPSFSDFLATQGKPAAASAPNLRQVAHSIAVANGIDPQLVHAMITTESSWNPKAVSDKGARGLMQLMPQTARRFGVTDSFDPTQNVRGGVQYLAELKKQYGGDVPKMLAAYYTGVGDPSGANARGYIERVSRNYPGAKPKSNAPPSFGAFLKQSKPPSADPVRQAGLLTRGWNFLWKPLVAPESLGGISKQQREAADVKLISSGSPWRAAAGDYLLGVRQRTANVAASLTSPGSLALAITSFGDSVLGDLLPGAAKTTLGAFRSGSGVAFAAQGAGAALTPQQPGETRMESARRRMMGAGMGLLAGAGEAAHVQEGVKAALRSHFGLDEDLAGKVAKHASEVSEARAHQSLAEDAAQRHQSAAVIDQEFPQEAARVQASLEAGMQQVEQEALGKTAMLHQQIKEQGERLALTQSANEAAKTRAGARLLADSLQGTLQEQSRVSAPFEEMGKALTKPVMTSNAARDIVTEEATKRGVQESEIPRKIYASLEPEAGGGAEPQGPGASSEGYSSTMVRNLLQSGVSPSEARSAVRNLGYAPKQVDRIMAMAMPEGEGAGVSFNTVTRLRQDIYDAADATQDANVKGALMSAYNRITDMQEKFATDNGKGAEYKQAKFEYMKFKRGLGSGMMSKWLDASDAQEQQLSTKIAAVLSPRVGEAIEGLLRTIGVDTADLRRSVQAIEQTEAEQKALPGVERAGEKEIAQEAAERQKSLQTSAKDRLRTLQEAAKERSATHSALAKQAREEASGAAKQVAASEKASGEVIPGRSATDLAHLSQVQLEAERIRETMNRMKGMGISNPWRLTLAGIGLLRMVMGSAWGMFEVGIGGGPLVIDKMMHSPKFQDWVIRQAGADDAPRATQTRIRRGLEHMAPTLRRLAKSQVGAAAIHGSTGMP